MRRFPLRGDESKPDSAISKVLEDAQDRQHDLSEEAITEEMIDERELKIQKVSGVVHLVTKVDGTIYKVQLT